MPHPIIRDLKERLQRFLVPDTTGRPQKSIPGWIRAVQEAQEKLAKYKAGIFNVVADQRTFTLILLMFNYISWHHWLVSQAALKAMVTSLVWLSSFLIKRH